LSPRSAWYAQQVGHPPRLLQLRRSRLPRPKLAVIQARSASKGNAGGLVWRRGAGTAKLPSLGASDLSPARHGTHNKSDILLVSSSFADPGSLDPSPPSSKPAAQAREILVASCGDAAPGRQSFRRSELPTCHPARHGTHNKSDILLVSSSFTDPGSLVFSRTSLSLRAGSDAPLAASRCRSRTVGCCRGRGTPGSC
jgi:hypothetical protein